MIKKIRRELYLLPRWEQKALLLLSLLLILGIAARIGVGLLPVREPPGLEDFIRESRALIAAFAEADSLERITVRSGESNGKEYVAPEPPNRVSQSRVIAGPVNINRADSVQLLPLPGIGPVFAGRIIKYRNLLGGFVSVGQLNEVYGLKPETVHQISESIWIDSSAVRKIRLDSISFRDLLRHPYLGIEDVRALIRYRDYRGHIASPEELYENFILPDSTLERVRPYLYCGN